jgi:hypothetical protein
MFGDVKMLSSTHKVADGILHLERRGHELHISHVVGGAVQSKTTHDIRQPRSRGRVAHTSES